MDNGGRSDSLKKEILFYENGPESMVFTLPTGTCLPLYTKLMKIMEKKLLSLST